MNQCSQSSKLLIIIFLVRPASHDHRRGCEEIRRVAGGGAWMESEEKSEEKKRREGRTTSPKGSRAWAFSEWVSYTTFKGLSWSPKLPNLCDVSVT